MFRLESSLLQQSWLLWVIQPRPITITDSLFPLKEEKKRKIDIVPPHQPPSFGCLGNPQNGQDF